MSFGNDKSKNIINRKIFRRALFWLFGGISLILTPLICQAAVYFSDNMESETTKWVAAAPWSTTTDSYHSSTNAWTDSKGSYYANNADVSLTMSDTINLSASTNSTSPSLVF